MTPTLESLGIDRLTVAQRLELIERIWESLADEKPPLGLSEVFKAELRRRDAELDANPQMALTWEQIRGQIEGKGR